MGCAAQFGRIDQGLHAVTIGRNISITLELTVSFATLFARKLRLAMILNYYGGCGGVNTSGCGPEDWVQIPPLVFRACTSVQAHFFPAMQWNYCEYNMNQGCELRPLPL